MDVQVTSFNQAWVADITDIRIAVGFVYLAAILALSLSARFRW